MARIPLARQRTVNRGDVNADSCAVAGLRSEGRSQSFVTAAFLYNMAIKHHYSRSIGGRSAFHTIAARNWVCCVVSCLLRLICFLAACARRVQAEDCLLRLRQHRTIAHIPNSTRSGKRKVESRSDTLFTPCARSPNGTLNPSAQLGTGAAIHPLAVAWHAPSVRRPPGCEHLCATLRQQIHAHVCAVQRSDVCTLVHAGRDIGWI